MAEEIYRKPVPVATPESDFFWDKTRKHELWIQKCVECDKAFIYPRMVCPDCLSENLEWFKTSGKGFLYTYMINHRPPPGFEDEAPYAIAIVQLDAGPRMMSNIVGIENTPENLLLDMPLEVVFEAIVDDMSLPKWRPAQS